MFEKIQHFLTHCQKKEEPLSHVKKTDDVSRSSCHSPPLAKPFPFPDNHSSPRPFPISTDNSCPHSLINPPSLAKTPLAETLAKTPPPPPPLPPLPFSAKTLAADLPSLAKTPSAKTLAADLPSLAKTPSTKTLPETPSAKTLAETLALPPNLTPALAESLLAESLLAESFLAESPPISAKPISLLLPHPFRIKDEQVSTKTTIFSDNSTSSSFSAESSSSSSTLATSTYLPIFPTFSTEDDKQSCLLKTCEAAKRRPFCFPPKISATNLDTNLDTISVPQEKIQHFSGIRAMWECSTPPQKNCTPPPSFQISVKNETLDTRTYWCLIQSQTHIASLFHINVSSGYDLKTRFQETFWDFMTYNAIVFYFLKNGHYIGPGKSGLVSEHPVEYSKFFSRSVLLPTFTQKQQQLKKEDVLAETVEKKQVSTNKVLVKEEEEEQQPLAQKKPIVTFENDKDIIINNQKDIKSEATTFSTESISANSNNSFSSTLSNVFNFIQSWNPLALFFDYRDEKNDDTTNKNTSLVNNSSLDKNSANLSSDLIDLSLSPSPSSSFSSCSPPILANTANIANIAKSPPLANIAKSPLLDKSTTIHQIKSLKTAPTTIQLKTTTTTTTTKTTTTSPPPNEFILLGLAFKNKNNNGQLDSFVISGIESKKQVIFQTFDCLLSDLNLSNTGTISLPRQFRTCCKEKSDDDNLVETTLS